MIPFISTDDLGTFMGQDLSSSDLATIAVDSACEAIRTHLNRPLNLTTETVTVDGSGTDTLLLAGPLVNVVSVTEDDIELEDDDYILATSMLYRVDACWPVGRRNIEITYTHGYAVDEDDVGADSGDVGTITRFPSDIREVALELAAGFMSVAETRFHAEAARDAVGGSEPEEGPALPFASFTRAQRRRLSPYRYRPV